MMCLKLWQDCSASVRRMMTHAHPGIDSKVAGNLESGVKLKAANKSTFFCMIIACFL